MTAAFENIGRPVPPSGQHVLVVEDEFFIAASLHDALAAHCGATILGPFPDLRSAGKALDSGARIDAAILDIKLPDGDVYELARRLRARRIPFGFSSGWSAAALPKEFRDAPFWEKPFDLDAIVQWLAALDTGQPDNAITTRTPVAADRR